MQILSALSLDSVHSIEEFLSFYQAKDLAKKELLLKERGIIEYLASLKLEMKTDPLKKQFDYYL